MWLFSGWDQTACKPCAVANVTADTVRVDAALLQRQAEAAEATQTGAEVWATRFPPEFATQGAMQSKLQSQHEVQRVDSRVPPGVSMHESSGTEEEVPGSEVASPQGCSLAQKRLKGIKGDAGAAVGTALRWVGLSELALEYPYEDLAAATDHFSPEHRLGAGGVGAVYRGKLRGATEVAIKVLADMGGVEGFEDEVRVLSRFRHPHLVTLMGFGQREGQKYLVYELMPGGDVEGKLRQSRAWLEQHMKGAAVPQAPFPWQQRLQVALGAAKGLAHMVGSTPKTFHRDIKPANILLDADGTPKMADFGLAAAVKDNGEEDKLAVMEIAGTPGYTCLSYIHSRHVTQESEVYSFGVVLLELLINRPPALASSQGDMVFPLLEAVQPYVPGAHARVLQCLDPSASWTDVAEEFADLALACLDPVPERRPPFNSVVKSLQRLSTMTQRPLPPSALEEDANPGSPSDDSPEGAGFGWPSWWR
ncbi:unnamed protein product [Effrenium voratum]|nr:unnamed protein product [Effrenium voratum]